jgi:hypothetical protein
MNWFRKLRKWWLCRKYGVCPTHLILMEMKGGYHPAWVCGLCVQENQVKNDARSNYNATLRVAMCEYVRGLERGKKGFRKPKETA